MKSPPRVPFTLCVGITGHRHEALASDYLSLLPEQIRDVLGLLARGAAAVQASAADCFAAGEPRFVFVSALADGADQIAAEAALELGFSLQAALPFARDEYRRDFTRAGAATRFDALIAKADRVLELPGGRDHEPEAYMMAGRATVAHCDVLVAVWDGLPARGRGGTAEVVQLAIRRGSPVVHLPVDGTAPARLLWSAFDPVVVTEGVQTTAERPFDLAHIEQTLAAELLPPTDPHERRFLKQFTQEQPRSYRARIEYPLLLAVTGVKRFKPGNFRDFIAPRRSTTNGGNTERHISIITAPRHPSTCSRKPIAGAIASPVISPRPTAAAMYSISCWAASPCASG